MKIVKKIFVILLALGTFLGTFFLEYHFAVSTQSINQPNVILTFEKSENIEISRGGNLQTLGNKTSFEILPGDVVKNSQDQKAEIRFDHNGVLRLSPQTTLKFSLLDNENSGFSFKLVQGKLWANTSLTPAVLNVVAGNVFLAPESAIFNVSYDDSKTQIYAYRHNVHVSLVPLNYVSSEISSAVPKDLINHFLLTDGNQSMLFNDTLQNNSDTLKKLFYSKLIKEFQYGVADKEQLKSDGWVSQNIQADKDFMQKFAADQLRNIRDKGLKVSGLDTFGYQLLKNTDRLLSLLTFSQDKELLSFMESLFGHLHDAEYLLLFNRSIEATERLNYFKKLTEEKNQNPALFADMFSARLQKEYQFLAFVTPTEPLYFAKNTLKEILLNNLGNDSIGLHFKFLILHQELAEASDLADSNSSLAKVSLEQYFKHFTQFIPAENEYPEMMKEYLAQDNQILDNLFRQHAAFYKDSFFSNKSQLELQWLNLMNTGNEKNEEKQTVISNKIDFLKQLKTFFLEDKIDIADARQIVFRLFREADDLQLPPDAQLAVGELFAKRLEDFGVFFRYLSSPEYSATTLHGSTRSEQFQQFLRAQQEQVSINEIRKEILGEQSISTTLSAEDISKKVRDDLSSNNISNIQLGSFDPSLQKLIPVENATLEAISFKAQYDFDQKLFYQIISEGKAFSNDGVTISQLKFLLQQQRATEQVVSPPGIENTSEQTQQVFSKTEQIARILILQKLKNAHVVTTQDKLEIIDLSQNQFQILAASFASDPSVTFSFTLTGKDSVVSSVVIQSKNGRQTLEGPLNLTELAEKITVQTSKVKRTK